MYLLLPFSSFAYEAEPCMRKNLAALSYAWNEGPKLGYWNLPINIFFIAYRTLNFLLILKKTALEFLTNFIIQFCEHHTWMTDIIFFPSHSCILIQSCHRKVNKTNVKHYLSFSHLTYWPLNQLIWGQF